MGSLVYLPDCEPGVDRQEELLRAILGDGPARDGRVIRGPWPARPRERSSTVRRFLDTLKEAIEHRRQDG